MAAGCMSIQLRPARSVVIGCFARMSFWARSKGRASSNLTAVNPLLFGILAGLIFGAVDVALMIPMQHPNKGTAMLGAFFSRFAIGFLIGVTRMPIPGRLRGVIVGLLISIPDAIVTKRTSRF